MSGPANPCVMDGRGHIEFVQAQCLPWRRIGYGLGRPDAEYKMLSRNPRDGACSALMRYPPGWSRDRDIRPEDIEATIYSALGIDWTTVRRDDPLGRGFEYVPFSDRDLYGPVHELWA